MTEIEFLEPPHGRAAEIDDDSTEDLTEDDPDDVRPAPSTAFLDRAVLASIGLLLVACVLPVVAAFQNLYTVKVTDRTDIDSISTGQLYAYGFDGWGRFQTTTSTLANDGTHITRWGIALTACAIGYALLAALLVALCASPRGMSRYLGIVTGWAVGVTAALAGVVVAGALEIESTRDGIAKSLGDSTTQSGTTPKVDFGIGACGWLSVVAVVVGVLMTVATLWLRRSPAFDDEVDEPDLDLDDDDLDHEGFDPDEDEYEDDNEDDDQQEDDFTALPAALPAPVDDGAAAHLPGRPAPHIVLSSTAGRFVALDQLPPGRTIVYVYPMTGRPGVALPDGWDDIPGARGCTPESCGFRDHHAELLAAGATGVFGLSSQTTEYQHEVVQRLGLPFELLADPGLTLAAALGLPTFTTSELHLYRRLTLVIRDGHIEQVFYPVFPPDGHADEVLGWLQAHPATAGYPPIG